MRQIDTLTWRVHLFEYLSSEPEIIKNCTEFNGRGDEALTEFALGVVS